MKVYGEIAKLLFMPRKNCCAWPVKPLAAEAQLRDGIEVKVAANDA